MKVIDLLKIIANGETPDIKDGANYYHYNKIENDYITGMGYNYEHYFSNINILDYLNDEVEIINDKPHSELVEQIYNEHMNYIYGNSPKVNNKIEKKINWWLLDEKESKKQLITEANLNFREIRDKINEIIDRLNGDE